MGCLEVSPGYEFGPVDNGEAHDRWLFFFFLDSGDSSEETGFWLCQAMVMFGISSGDPYWSVLSGNTKRNLAGIEFYWYLPNAHVWVLPEYLGSWFWWGVRFVFFFGGVSKSEFKLKRFRVNNAFGNCAIGPVSPCFCFWILMNSLTGSWGPCLIRGKRALRSALIRDRSQAHFAESIVQRLEGPLVVVLHLRMDRPLQRISHYRNSC